MSLLDVLPHGHARAKTKRELAFLLGTKPREIEAEIEALRKSGKAAICSDGSGYWRPESAQEYRDNLDSRRRRLATQALTVRGETRALARWEARTAEQSTLWEGA